MRLWHVGFFVAFMMLPLAIVVAVFADDPPPCNSKKVPSATECGEIQGCPLLDYPDPACGGIFVNPLDAVQDCEEGGSPSQRCQPAGLVECTKSYVCGWKDFGEFWTCFPIAPLLDPDGKPVKSWKHTSEYVTCVEG